MDALYCTRIKQQKKIIMKKVLAILALALFIGGISAPVIAANNNTLTVITMADDDPKQKEKSEEKSEAKSEEKSEKKAEATKKSGDCAKHETKTAEKSKSDCSKK